MLRRLSAGDAVRGPALLLRRDWGGGRLSGGVRDPRPVDPGQPTRLSHGGSQCQPQAREGPGNGVSVTSVLILERRNLNYFQ